jgi:DNA-binding NarL/FixJ family response regulator
MIDLRVLIVADDPLARAGLATVMDGQPGCAVVGQVSGEDDLPGSIDVYHPDVLMWDLGWDPEAVLTRFDDLDDAGPPVVAILPDETYASRVRAAGARGLVLRETSADKLMTAATAVAGGMVVMDPSIATAALPSAGHIPVPPAEELTPRELDVLRLLSEGLPNKTIAHRLGISEHTVKFHVNSILAKLGAQSRTEAVIRATRLGLILL